ncbi:MAG: Na+/H+ antiporter subunit E [Clostridiales bacterium]|nr:Na+/H+ antiporter subunit E [Clostridiales bacterium]HBM81863.1 sodium:proton antiporter [Clostridiaceae bacterium]
MFYKKLSCFISTFIFCFIIWIALTLTFNIQELLGGILVSIITALFSSKFFIHNDAFYLFNPKRLFYLIAYISVFIRELVKANIDVAKRAYNPKLPVNPGIVKVRTWLKSEYGLAMLCNSITLTPGTISLDVVEEDGRNYIYVHWIDVQSRNHTRAGNIIKGSLESGIRRIWN